MLPSPPSEGMDNKWRIVVRLICLMIFFLKVYAANTELSPDIEQEIKALEKVIAQTDIELKQAELTRQNNLTELNKTKLSLLKRQKAHQKLDIQKSLNFEYLRPNQFTKVSLFQKDFDRYPPNLYPNYFGFKSATNAFSMDFHGWFQGDQDIFSNFEGLYIDNGNDLLPIINQSTVDRLWIRRLRPTIEGDLYDFIHYLFNIDFGLGSIDLYDAFIDINYYRALGLQVGYQMSLVSGIENFFNNFDYLSRAFTMEMGSTAVLAPDRQLGVTLHGSFGPSGKEPYFRGLSYLGFDDMFSYQMGIYNGIPDHAQPKSFTTIGSVYPFPNLRGSQSIYTNSNKAFAGRVFFNPFIDKEDFILQHLGLGFAGSAETAHLQTGQPDLVSVGQNPIFSFTALPYDSSRYFVVSANGPRSRLHPQATYGFGPFGILADWTQTLHNLQAFALGEFNNIVGYYPNSVKQINKASQIQFIYNITQEAFNLFSFIPNNNFKSFEKGAYGGLQLVFRLSRLSLDPSVFKYSQQSGANTFYAYADPRISVQRANTWSIGLNWYFNSFLRLTTEYDQTSFVGGCSTGGLNSPSTPGCLTGGSYIFASSSQVVNRPDEKIIMQRIQLSF